MVIDTSAIVAALSNETDGARFRDAMKEADERSMSALTAFETRIVLGARSDVKLREFELLLNRMPIEVVPFDADQAGRAYAAYRRFGKGSGHPAQLNLVDCAAYALAKHLSEELLFKGHDFAKTDVVPALQGS
jgi:ribonuclease VapC